MPEKGQGGNQAFSGSVGAAVLSESWQVHSRLTPYQVFYIKYLFLLFLPFLQEFSSSRRRYIFISYLPIS